jgi:transposase
MTVIPPPWEGANEEEWQRAGCSTCAAREREVERLERENERLRQRLADVETELEQARRAGKRQAAPFSKGRSAATGRPAGRRPGAAYGQRAHRLAPEHIDREVEVVLPASCRACGGVIDPERVAEQYQEDLPEVRPIVTRFRVHIGRCRRCGQRVQAGHPEQTSDALGAAAAHVGPRAVALAVQLNKVTGASMGKTVAILRQVGGIRLTAGGLSQALDRAAKQATPTYNALIEAVRHSRVVAPDETGWRVGGRLQWLWTFVGDQVTVYRIQPGRGFREAATVLGEQFAGVLERDGWAPYRQFTAAVHQSCTAHLLRRCHELLQTARGGARQVPLTVRQLLLDGLAVRAQRDSGPLSPADIAGPVEDLERRLEVVLAKQVRQPANRRLLKHLAHEREALFTYLKRDGVEATNWRAEQAIRPAVVNRKVWGGNRTPAGAHIQQVLVSLLRTCQQQARDPTPILVDLLRSPTPAVAPLEYGLVPLPATVSAAA